MAKTKTSPDDMISTPEAGVELGITATRVLVLIKTGRLHAMRVGKVWIIRRGDLDAVRDRPPGRPRKNTEAKPKPSKPDEKNRA